MPSFIQPFQPDTSSAPPWGWNPGKMFAESFNEARRTKIMEEQAAVENQLNQIMMPYKQQAAAFEIEKLKQDIDLAATRTQLLRDTRAKVVEQQKKDLLDSASGKNPYSLFDGTSDGAQDRAVEDAVDEETGLGLDGFSSANPLLQGGSRNPLEDLPEIDTSKIPPSGLVADASSGPTATQMSAMRTATDAVRPEPTADEMMLDRLSTNFAKSDNPLVGMASAKPDVNEAPPPRIPLDAPAKNKSESADPMSQLDGILTRRQMFKRQHDALMDTKNYRLDGVKLQRNAEWENATAEAVQKLAPLGISDPKTLDALTELPSELRRKAQQVVKQNIADGKDPGWWSAIESVGGVEGGKGQEGKTPKDPVTESLSQLKLLQEAYPDGVPPHMASVTKSLEQRAGAKQATPLDEYISARESQAKLERARANNLPFTRIDGAVVQKSDYDAKSNELTAIRGDLEITPEFYESVPEIDYRKFASRAEYETAVKAARRIYRTPEGTLVTPWGDQPLSKPTPAKDENAAAVEEPEFLTPEERDRRTSEKVKRGIKATGRILRDAAGAVAAGAGAIKG
jgi:hypothetical protein